MSTDGKTVTLTLTRAQALVLFEWLNRTDSVESLPLEHQAEQQVLWFLTGELEKALEESLADDYQDLVARARKEVAANW